MEERDNICYGVPVRGYMVKGPDGNYHLDEERSVFADIPADTIARFLIEKLTGSTPPREGSI